MTGMAGTLGSRRIIPAAFRTAREPLAVICIYTTLYVALDWISTVQVLPGIGFTLWNPPPACSLALLLTKGLRYAPALFLAAVLADGLNAGFATEMMPTLAIDAVIAAGYTAVSVLLRPFAAPPRGLNNLRETSWFLVIVCTGTLAIAGLVGAVLTSMHELPGERLLATVRHMWVGDVTGIIGLFPALMLAPAAWERWRELPLRTRLMDCGGFALALGAALGIVFGVAATREFHALYLLLLPVIWIGARHGLAWCAFAILIEQISLLVVVTLRGYSLADVMGFQILSLTIAAAGLVLGAVVTERQRSETHLRLQQAEVGRMARITAAGALGSAIVHEISQPLATVASYAHACRLLLRAEPPDHAALTETLIKVEKETLRAGEIAERLREFLSKGSLRRSRGNLGAMTREVVATLRDEARLRGVAVSVDGHASADVVADRLQVEQILLNLIRNAIEAAAQSDGRERRVRVRLYQSGSDVGVDVEDNGPGVAAEIAGHLFEPFVTGKANGLGLGLLLSRQIAKGHGGDLWHDRTMPEGTRFTLRLPGDGPDADGG